MDARVALEDLRDRTAGLQADPITARRALEVFLQHAQEPVTYEDGANVDDWITANDGTIDEPRHWYPESTRPEAGSLMISLSRAMYIVDDDEDFVEFASTFFELVFEPSTTALLPGALAAAAPSGHRLADPDPPGTEEGPASEPGYVTTLEAFATSVLDQLGPLADEPVVTMKVDGNVPTEPTKASLLQPAREAVRLEVHEDYVNDGWASDELDVQLRGRQTTGAHAETIRVLLIVLEHCSRPVDCGAARIIEDQLRVEYVGPWDVPGLPERHQLRIERRTAFEPTTPAGYSPEAQVGVTLFYDAAPDLGELPPHHTLVAPAAAAPHAAPGESAEADSIDDATQVVRSLDEVTRALEAGPLSVLLGRPADEITTASPI